MKKILVLLSFAILSVSFTTSPVNEKPTYEGVYNEILEQEIEFPDIVFAQCMLESGNLTSKICKENNNLFGMKVPSRRETLATGQRYGYAKYAYWQESIGDYYLYQQMLFSKKSYTRKEYLAHINKTYSETKGYVNRLNRILKEFASVIYEPPADRNDGKFNLILAQNL